MGADELSKQIPKCSTIHCQNDSGLLTENRCTSSTVFSLKLCINWVKFEELDNLENSLDRDMFQSFGKPPRINKH